MAYLPPPIALPVSFSTMPGGRSPTKKALLVGISYHSETESCCQDPLGPIPTSIPTVKRLEAFLQGWFSPSTHDIIGSQDHSCSLDYCRYTDITVMTDEEGVEGRLQPTRDNMVRSFPQSYQISMYRYDMVLQIREMEALSSRVRPGDRRVFYCANRPIHTLALHRH